MGTPHKKEVIKECSALGINVIFSKDKLCDKFSSLDKYVNQHDCFYISLYLEEGWSLCLVASPLIRN